ncbi:hypothetical protein Dimus_017230 [Dionaea muscipula]
MEKKKLSELDDKEYMRKAMLKHEEIFRQQVYELHRLYQIQKILMNGYEAAHLTRQKRETWIVGDQNGRSQVKTKEYVAESKGNEIDESKIELTLGPPDGNPMQKKEKPSFSGQSISSSSTGSSQIMRRTTPPRIYQRITEGDFSKASEAEIELRNGQDINLKHPPWLLQALTLKLT